MLRIACLFSLLATPALSECMTLDPSVGISELPFGLKDGGEMQVSLTDELPNGVAAEYRDRYGEPLRWFGAVYGVFPVMSQTNASVDPASGETAPWPSVETMIETKYDKTPPRPGSVANWQSGGTETRQGPDGSAEYRFTAAYTFEPEKTVTLKGCEYRIIPVEGVFKADGEKWSGRWAYFTEFDVAVQTKGTDSRSGENWTNGITSIGWE